MQIKIISRKEAELQHFHGREILFGYITKDGSAWWSINQIKNQIPPYLTTTQEIIQCAYHIFKKSMMKHRRIKYGIYV